MREDGKTSGGCGFVGDNKRAFGWMEEYSENDDQPNNVVGKSGPFTGQGRMTVGLLQVSALQHDQLAQGE